MPDVTSVIDAFLFFGLRVVTDCGILFSSQARHQIL